MANEKYYVDQAGAQAIVKNIKEKYSPIDHTHEADPSLSTSSTNAVQASAIASFVNSSISFCL